MPWPRRVVTSAGPAPPKEWQLGLPYQRQADIYQRQLPTGSPAALNREPASLRLPLNAPGEGNPPTGGSKEDL